MPRRKPSISRRLLLPAFVASLVIGALSILGQLAWIAFDETRTARGQLDRVATAAIPSIEQALWEADDEQAKALVDGVSTMRWVAHIRLVDERGRVVERGRPPEGILATRTYALAHDQAPQVPLGTLEVTIDNQGLRERLIQRGGLFAIELILALGAAAAILVYLFRTRVAEPLGRVSQAMERFSLNADDLEASREAVSAALAREPASEEISRLVNALATMRMKVEDDLGRIQTLQTELRRNRDELEAKVALRTRELEEKAQTLEEQRAAIEKLANTDALTGVMSRRHFIELAEREMLRAARADNPVAVLALDIDHFKRINDTHGHAAGDAVLRWFASLCLGALRGVDLIGRTGGEEFFVVLPDTGAPGARAVAERLRAAIAKAPAPLPGDLVWPVTVSIGVAVGPEAGTDLDALMQAADHALYAAKDAGRNRVEVAPPGATLGAWAR